MQIDDLPIALIAGFATLFYCVAGLSLLSGSSMRLVGVALLTFASCTLAVALALMPIWVLNRSNHLNGIIFIVIGMLTSTALPAFWYAAQEIHSFTLWYAFPSFVGGLVAAAIWLVGATGNYPNSAKD